MMSATPPRPPVPAQGLYTGTTSPNPPAPIKPRSSFRTGFGVTMGVMSAVTLWSIAWGVLALIVVAIAASNGGGN